jgi:FkbM family methyltransferase
VLVRLIPESLAYPISNLWKEESNRNQRARRLLTFAGWQLWKRTIGKPVTVTLFNGKRFVAHPDCQVSSGVMYTRIPNSKNILFVRQHLSGGALVDVGANVWSVSLLLADKVQDAILFEPNRVAAARARENIALNGLDFRVFEIALSDYGGEVAFESHGVDVGGHVVSGSGSKPSCRLVKCVTFDDFIGEHGPPKYPISLVKIDVEGHENSVLRGMRQLFTENRPPLVMFEYLEKTNIHETLSFFAQVGYRVFELQQNGPIRVIDRVEPLQDLFACPLECASLYGVANQSS